MLSQFNPPQISRKGDKALDRFIERLSHSNARSLLLNSSAGDRSKDRLDIKAIHLPEVPLGNALLNQFMTQREFKYEIHLTLPEELVAEKRQQLLNRGIKDQKQLEAEIDAYRSAQEGKLAVLRSKLDAFVSNAENFKKGKGVDPLWFGYPIIHIPHSRKAFRFASQSKTDEQGILAPVFLWPITVTRDPQQRFTWHLSLNASEGRSLKANTALFEWIKSNKGVDIPELNPDLLDDNRLTVDALQDYLGVIEKSLSLPRDSLALPSELSPAPASQEKSSPACKVHNAGLLGMYVHQKESILRDLKDINKLVKIPSNLLRALLDGIDGAKELGTGTEASKVPAISDVTALDCDFSQKAAAILGSTQGNIIVHGPPGTGKSQVITEIVIQALHQGKRVLVCCEKKSALEVIKKRLRKLDLDTFCALIQDTQKDRKTILTALRDLKQHGDHTAPFHDPRASLTRYKAQINRQTEKIIAANNLLFSPTSFGLVWNRLIAFNSRYSRKLSDQSKDALKSLDANIDNIDSLHAVIDEIRDIYVLWKAADVPSNPLRSVLKYNLGNYSNDIGVAIGSSASNLHVAFCDLKNTINTRHIPRDLTQAILTQPSRRLALIGVLAELDARTSNDTKQIAASVISAILENKPWEFAATQVPQNYARLEQYKTNPFYQHMSSIPSHAELEYALTDVETLSKLQDSFLGKLRQSLHIRTSSRLRRFKKKVFFPCSRSVTLDATRDLLDAALAYSALCVSIREFLHVTGNDIDVDLSPTVENWINVTSVARAIATFFAAFPDITTAFGSSFSASRLDRMFLEACRHSFETNSPPFEDVHALYLHCMKLHSALNDMSLHIQQEDSTSLTASLFESLSLNGDLDGICEAKTNSLIQHAPKVKDLLRYEDRMSRASKTTQSVIESIEQWQGAADKNDWEHAVGYAASKKHVERSLLELPELNHVTSDSLADWHTRLNKSVDLARQALQAATVDTWKNVRSKKASETTTADLHKAFPLRGKERKSLRKILESNLDLALSIFPVWMGNPEALCSTLPLQHDLFDIVIFDEASQCLTEDAIPIIYRGKSIVISGDDKQLPPTNFFKQKAKEDDYIDSDSDEDNDDTVRQTMHEYDLIQDKDLLQTARKMHLKEGHLLLHYRSNHNDLIQFSNHAFYGKKLRFVPNKENNADGAIELVQVNGTYDKQTNHDEAMKVIATLRRFMDSNELSQKSVGIVTLNMQQRELVNEKLNEERQADPQFSAYISHLSSMMDDGEDRSLFIKNLEEVQGDERDIIVISTTFGLDRDGAFRRHFGPIIQSGGDRRLNVLVTRAKRKMVVITSIPEEQYNQDLDIISAQSKERAVFYAYLKYARAVSLGLPAEAKNVLEWLSRSTVGHSSIKDIPKNTEEMYLTESPFESEVFESLEARFPGRLATQVWQGSFRIDLAIRSAKHPGKYILGIEADGLAYHSDPLKVEEDRTRQRVLEGLGWRIERVLSTDWWEDYKRETERLSNIIESIDALQQQC